MSEQTIQEIKDEATEILTVFKQLSEQGGISSSTIALGTVLAASVRADIATLESLDKIGDRLNIMSQQIEEIYMCMGD